MGFEIRLDTLIANAGGSARVVVATAGVELLLVEGEIDPHAWNALTNGIVYVENIAAAMATLISECSDLQGERSILSRAARALHASAAATFGKLPEGGERLSQRMTPLVIWPLPTV